MTLTIQLDTENHRFHGGGDSFPYNSSPDYFLGSMADFVSHKGL